MLHANEFEMYRKLSDTNRYHIGYKHLRQAEDMFVLDGIKGEFP
jgi:hypothetical protein